MPKAPPKFVKNVRAWNYTLEKLALTGKLTSNGDPQNYAAACAIYKNVVKKYPAFSVAEMPIYQETINLVPLEPSAVADLYPVGCFFWWEDCIVEAIPADGGIAAFSTEVGKIMVRGIVQAVDEKGPHHDWVGRVTAFPASRVMPFE